MLMYIYFFMFGCFGFGCIASIVWRGIKKFGICVFDVIKFNRVWCCCYIIYIKWYWRDLENSRVSVWLF